jgi:inorganic pyrophosphatase
MVKASARHTVLYDTASRDKKSGDYRAVIETPKGSRNKYRYDSGCDCFELATTLPEGMAFPFDFGLARHARTHEAVKALAQLRPHTLDDIKGFFVDYNRLHDKKFEVRGEHGPNRAAKCVTQGEAAYAKK